jgi:hypothetical protein
MTILCIVIWAILVAAACGLAFLLLVAQAFGRRERRGAKQFGVMMLGAGIKVAPNKPLVIFLVSWTLWTAMGTLVILLIRSVGTA